MENDKRHEALTHLLVQAEKQGYITFDNIMQYADDNFLSNQDLDWLSNALTTRNISVYDQDSENHIIRNEMENAKEKTMEKRNIRKMNAARVCFGISRIGYTPASAICDIVDNSVSAHAKNVYIQIIKKENKYNDNKKNNIREYLIIDDGDGMSAEGIGRALDLGSSDLEYAQDTLSKFGLGLKSASFAQGKRLEVISGDGESIHKEYVDLDDIEEDYFSVEDDLSEEDKNLAEEYFANGKKGTIIRITKIHTNNHPSTKSTVDELKEKLGVIYYYFLKKDIHIYVGNIEIEAFDPLFINEAGDNNLNENEWDGKSVQWLLRPQEIMIDKDMKVNGKIEITMLPHPKVRKSENISDKSIREHYHISASNYGFYIYRNKRLINWANRLDIIPQDQDYYAFRGRININSDADDAFNIDVSKSHINLSEDARESLDDYIADYKRKCKAAWINAWNKYRAQISQDSNDISNDITNELGDCFDSINPKDDSDQYNEELERRQNEIVEQSIDKGIEETLTRISDEGSETKTKEDLTPDDIAETMKGSASVDELDKIFKVHTITDNELWEPYVDAEKKECVRISKTHRYAKLIYENNSENKDMQVLFELFLYVQSKAELQVRKEYQYVSLEKVTEILEEYRREVSEKLAKLCRKQEANLPPNLGDR